MTTRPAHVRAVLDYYAEHGWTPTLTHFGIPGTTLRRWQTLRAEFGDTWPTQAEDDAWVATAQARDKRAAQCRAYRRSSHYGAKPLWVPSLGTTRRVRALMAIGWRARDIAARGPWETGEAVLELGKRPMVHRRNADHIDRIFRDLCMTPGPSATTRDRAARSGWAPPLAWDNIDDPHEDPTASDLELQRWVRWWTSRGYADVDEVVVAELLNRITVPSTHAERCEALRRWLRNGGSERSLCHAHGWKEGRYTTRPEPRKDAA